MTGWSRKRWESAVYLDYVRSHPCCTCDNSPPSEAHHWHPNQKGMGRKPSDCWSVPLCRVCHQEFHDTGSIGGEAREDLRWRFMYAEWELMGKWLSHMTAEDPRLPVVDEDCDLF